jgi:hypothetical protein
MLSQALAMLLAPSKIIILTNIRTIIRIITIDSHTITFNTLIPTITLSKTLIFIREKVKNQLERRLGTMHRRLKSLIKA